MWLDNKLSDRHFTDSANRIITQLSARACDRSMSAEITQQTIVMLALWSLLRWERKVGLAAIERTGVDTFALARDVDDALRSACEEFRKQNGPPKLQELPSGGRGIIVDWATPLAPLLSVTEHEALALSHNWVGSEHLALAIIRLADPRLREVLDHHRVDYDAVRQAVLEILS
jgi:hypothetical protein